MFENLPIGSTAAQVGGIVGPHHAASKAGLIGLRDRLQPLHHRPTLQVNGGGVHMT